MLKTSKIVGLFVIVGGMASYVVWHSTLPDEIQLYSENTTPSLNTSNPQTKNTLKELSENKNNELDLKLKKLGLASHEDGKVTERTGADQSMPEFLNDVERLNWARKIILTGTPTQKFCALQAIFNHDPLEAAKDLTELMQAAKKSAADAEFLVQGIVFIENQKSVFLDSDLASFYENGNASMQKTVAKILADRGDPSLMNRYFSETSLMLHSEDPQVRVNTLHMMGSLNNPAVIPFALEMLNDKDSQVKIGALELMATLGAPLNSTAIQTLLTDENPRVRVTAQRALNNLERKASSTNPTQATTEHTAGLPDHGFPVVKSEIANEFPSEMPDAI